MDLNTFTPNNTTACSMQDQPFFTVVFS